MLSSDVFDLPIGLRKMKRAETTLLQHGSENLAALGKPQLLEIAWALSTILLANQQGLRLVPDVFTVAESVSARSIGSSFRMPADAPRPSSPAP